MRPHARRVVVVEDHPMFRERLAQLISAEPDLALCGEADNAADAVVVIRKTFADLAIIDLTLKGSGGLNLIKALRALGIAVPVLVISMHEESLYAERVIRAGANGYITKQHETTEVLHAIRKVLAGEIYLSAEAIADLDVSRDALMKPVPRQSFSRLSEREIEVLRLISLGRTTREIALELKVGVASVDTYRARIKDKIGLRNGIELQRFALRCFAEDE
jgi:DNA-binding NarL/FixJ family response regulator